MRGGEKRGPSVESRLSHFRLPSGTSRQDVENRRPLGLGFCSGPPDLVKESNGLEKRKRKKTSRGAARLAAPITPAAIETYLRSCPADQTAPRVSELARRLNVSRGTLISFVKKLRGTTPAKYFRQRRIRLAKTLLQRGWPLDRVARQSGFGTRRTFFRSFRAETGMTPDAYRTERNVPRQHHPRRDRLLGTVAKN